MEFKHGVAPKGLQVEALLGVILTDQIFSSLGEKLVVTSLTDSKHSPNSLHYKGQAFDVRIWNLKNVGECMKKLILVLQPLGFDVVLEDDHIHVEFDPK